MKYPLFLGGLLCLAGSSWAAAPLLTPQELAPLLEQTSSNHPLRVIDIRDPKEFAANHIPGAVSAPYGQWRGPANNPGDLPATEKLVALLQALGLQAHSHAVVVSTGKDSTDFGASARVYWTLKSLGLTELSIVNGGMQAWAAAQLPQTTAVSVITPSSYAPSFSSEWLVSREEVLTHVQQQDAHLIDARPTAFYEGDKQAPAAKIAGTLPGAQSLDYNQLFAPKSSLLDSQATQAMASRIALTPEQDTVAFCNTGHWAATQWFALSEIAGQPRTKLYAGSMVDWTQAPEPLPTANTPSRGEQIMRSIRNSLERLFN